MWTPGIFSFQQRAPGFLPGGTEQRALGGLSLDAVQKAGPRGRAELCSAPCDPRNLFPGGFLGREVLVYQLTGSKHPSVALSV